MALFVVAAAWVRYLEPWISRGVHFDKLAARSEHSACIVTEEEELCRKRVTDELADVVDVVLLELYNFKGRPRLHLVE